MNQPEKLLPPGELSLRLEQAHGLCVTPDYLRALRSHSEINRLGLFVAGCARASEVFAWLKVNRFRRASRSRVAA